MLSHIIDIFPYASSLWDQTWLLYAAYRMISGARLYGPVVVETDPPLIIWFSAVPAYLAHVFQANPVVLFELLVTAMVFARVAWCVRILRAAGVANTPVSTCVAVLAIVSAEVPMSGYAYGRREHLLIILALPYILAATFSRGSSSRLPRPAPSVPPVAWPSALSRNRFSSSWG